MRVSRFLFLALLIILMSGLFTTSAQDPDFDWGRFEGETIRGIFIQGPWIDSVRPHIAAFEELTGITVEIEVLPEAQAWDKIRVEMQAENVNLDVFFNQTSRFGNEFVSNGWVEPLNDYIADPELTNADFDWETDFLDYSRTAVTFGDLIIAIPTDRTLGPMVHFRRDVLEEYGVDVPETLEELGEAARYIWEESGNTLPGIVYRGSGASATSHFAHVMHEFGAQWEDEDGNPLINTPENIAAFKWYGDTLRESGSVGAIAFDFPETVNAFLIGDAAFTLELGVNPSNIADESASNIAGLVGHRVIPRGPGPEENRHMDPCVPLRPFGVSISAFSENKEAAWYFIQYIVGKEAQLDYIKAGRVAARTSAWESEDFAASLSDDAREYWEAQSEASQICYPTLGHAPPSILDAGRAREIIGQVIETAILGGDVEAAADQAQQELEMLRMREQRGN
jgi:multiple sugar transport system substrate-binding protein